MGLGFVRATLLVALSLSLLSATPAAAHPELTGQTGVVEDGRVETLKLDITTIDGPIYQDKIAVNVSTRNGTSTYTSDEVSVVDRDNERPLYRLEEGEVVTLVVDGVGIGPGREVDLELATRQHGSLSVGLSVGNLTGVADGNATELSERTSATYDEEVTQMVWDSPGGEDYVEMCADCHGVHGQWTGPTELLDDGTPDLSDPGFWRTNSPEELHRSIMEGTGAMPGFGDELTSSEAIEVMMNAASLAGLSLDEVGSDVEPTRTPRDTPESRGERIYEEECAACHASDGSGAKMPNQPDFRDPAFWRDLGKEEALDAVRNGREIMPPFDQLTEWEVMATLEYAADTFVEDDIEPFEPRETRTPKQTVTRTPTPTSTPTRTPALTPTPTEAPELRGIELEVEPTSQTVSPGENVSWNATLDWEPGDWQGVIHVEVTGSGFGIERSRTFEVPVGRDQDPPIKAPLEFEMPEKAPPTTYSAVANVSADGKSASEEVEVTVDLPLKSTPGLSAPAALLGTIAAGLYAARERRRPGS